MLNTELVSLAIVAKDKEEDSYIVSAYPIESIPTNTVGNIGEPENTITMNADINGDAYTVNVNKDNIIEAKWEVSEGNRYSAPDVCKGELIKVYNIKGSDEYYWKPFKNEPTKRKREKTFSFWSNKSSIEGIDESNFITKGYYTLIDTFNKLLKLHTSDNDGEATTYTGTINTKKGTVTIIDGLGNKIDLKSTEGVWTVKSNNLIELNTKHVVINATDTVTMNTGIYVVNSDETKINP